MYRSDKQKFSMYIYAILSDYKEKMKSTGLEFPKDIDGDSRRLIHCVCRKLNLGHKSSGGKANRRIAVFHKDLFPVWV